MKLSFVVPGNPGQRTGGYLYDARISSQLRALGWSVDVIGLAGRFPLADALARQSMERALASCPSGQAVVIDGLALGALPEVLEAHAGRLKLIGLIHHPLSDETGLDAATKSALLASERRALSALRALIVTSHFTARRLQEIGLTPHRAQVVEPGVDRAPLAERARRRLAEGRNDRTQTLLCVASLTPRKGQNLLVRALAALADHPWRCVLVGSPDRAPEFAARVRQMIDQNGLADRIRLTGEADSDALEQAYRQASVCVLPSWYEGYGMVISEALAHGLPLIATTGGALADTVPACCALRVPPGDVAALREALRRWLVDPELRLACTRAAVARRETLPDWPAAGRAFARLIEATR